MICKNKKILVLWMVLLFALFLTGCPGGAQQNGDTKPTITLGQVPFEQEWVPLHIIKVVAEDLGYPTEISEGDVGVVYLGLSRGDIDIYPDVWLPTLHTSYMEQYSDSIELLSTMYDNAPNGWAVPTYVEIDSIADLQENSELFGNRVVGVEPGAGMMEVSKETIEAYDLDLTLLESSTPAMLATVSRAVQNQEPIVFLAWRPHTMFQDFDIKLLEDPEGIWEFDDVMIGVNAGLQDKAPDLYEFLSDFKISIDEVEAIMARMSAGEDIETLAKEWVNENLEANN